MHLHFRKCTLVVGGKCYRGKGGGAGTSEEAADVTEREPVAWTRAAPFATGSVKPGVPAALSLLQGDLGIWAIIQLVLHSRHSLVPNPFSLCSPNLPL